MSAAMQELLAILDLERLEHNLFRGRSPKLDWQRVFGGQTIAQALVAAQRTVEPNRLVHSLHGYFMRPGDTSLPIVYEVDRIRDGGSFTTRRVVAIQHGQAIFSLEASFQVEARRLDVGIEHRAAMREGRGVEQRHVGQVGEHGRLGRTVGRHRAGGADPDVLVRLELLAAGVVLQHDRLHLDRPVALPVTPDP